MAVPPDNPGQRIRPPAARPDPTTILTDHEREKRRQQRPVKGNGATEAPSTFDIGQIVRLERLYTEEEIGDGSDLPPLTLAYSGIWMLETRYDVHYSGLLEGFGVYAGLIIDGPSFSGGDHYSSSGIPSGAISLATTTWVYLEGGGPWSFDVRPVIQHPFGTDVGYSEASAWIKAIRIRPFES